MENMHDNVCNADSYIYEYRKILNNMIKGMTSAELTDSISRNFIVQMIPHHMAAIEMSENVLKYTENSELISIARNIISEQTKSIENMRSILRSCSEYRNPVCKVRMYELAVDRIMKTMFYQMKRAYTDSRINCNFMREMIPHHMGAVLMSENALKYEICPSLVPILNAIISSQEEGIRQMRNRLKIESESAVIEKLTVSEMGKFRKE